MTSPSWNSRNSLNFLPRSRARARPRAARSISARTPCVERDDGFGSSGTRASRRSEATSCEHGHLRIQLKSRLNAWPPRTRSSENASADDDDQNRDDQHEVDDAEDQASSRHPAASDAVRIRSSGFAAEDAGDNRRDASKRTQAQQDPAHQRDHGGHARGRLLTARQTGVRIDRHRVHGHRRGRTRDWFSRRPEAASARRAIATRRTATRRRTGWSVPARWTSRRPIAPGRYSPALRGANASRSA